MTTRNMKSALHNYRQHLKRDAADYAHLDRWLAEAQDPIWEKLAHDIKEHGAFQQIENGPYLFIGAALRARKLAESAESPSITKSRILRREKNERKDMLTYAATMIDVIQSYPRFERFLVPPSPPDPDVWPRPPTSEQLEAMASLEWLTRNAGKLRVIAQTPTKDEIDWDDFASITVSRQNAGNGKSPRSRELGVFMKWMVNFTYRASGKPHYNAVATMTNIAFPDADMVAEHVRAACKPTTRMGRRPKTGTPRQ
jgi:hypothetical protein